MKSIKNHKIECANCWGHQEYSGIAINKEVDIFSQFTPAFIIAFVKKHMY